MMKVMKALHLLPILSFVLILVSSAGHSTRNSRATDDALKPQPFDFIKHLQGCHKGNTTKGLTQLKHYLHQFGYFDHDNNTHYDDDVFDDALESAIKTYQGNYHITPTGALNAATVARMTMPRCGVADIVNGVNTMQRNNHDHSPSGKSMHTVAHFSFFPNRPRWDRSALTYGFLPGTPPQAASAAANAFRRWASATHFSFSPVNGGQRADLVIGYFRGEHGDGHPFDGRGGVLAHAFAPRIGRFHYDADEVWSTVPHPMAMHLESVALHEIGHLLGLQHSNVLGAAMFPTIRQGHRLDLHHDDVQGIRVLYGV